MPDAQGSLSPITTSSSQHTEESDNHTEYYVKGGDEVTDNNIGVTSSPDDRYTPGPTTTEPDPKGDLAMQKSDICCSMCKGDACDGSCCDDCDCGGNDIDPDPDATGIEKSLWGGFFQPITPDLARRQVYRQE